MTLGVERGVEMERALLEAGADPNVINPERYEASALHLAVYRGFEMVQALLSAGADPGSVDSRGRTPLEWAVANGPGRDEAVRSLELEAGEALLAAKMPQWVLDQALRAAGGRERYQDRNWIVRWASWAGAWGGVGIQGLLGPHSGDRGVDADFWGDV